MCQTVLIASAAFLTCAKQPKIFYVEEDGRILSTNMIVTGIVERQLQ